MLGSGVNRLSEGLFISSHALWIAIAVPNSHLIENLRLTAGSESPSRKMLYAKLAYPCQLRVQYAPAIVVGAERRPAARPESHSAGVPRRLLPRRPPTRCCYTESARSSGLVPPWPWNKRLPQLQIGRAN